jgi:hypothetical protein
MLAGLITLLIGWWWLGHRLSWEFSWFPSLPPYEFQGSSFKEDTRSQSYRALHSFILFCSIPHLQSMQSPQWTNVQEPSAQYSNSLALWNNNVCHSYDRNIPLILKLRVFVIFFRLCRRMPRRCLQTGSCHGRLLPNPCILNSHYHLPVSLDAIGL